MSDPRCSQSEPCSYCDGTGGVSGTLNGQPVKLGCSYCDGTGKVAWEPPAAAGSQTYG